MSHTTPNLTKIVALLVEESPDGLELLASLRDALFSAADSIRASDGFRRSAKVESAACYLDEFLSAELCVAA